MGCLLLISTHQVRTAAVLSHSQRLTAWLTASLLSALVHPESRLQLEGCKSTWVTLDQAGAMLTAKHILLDLARTPTSACYDTLKDPPASIYKAHPLCWQASTTVCPRSWTHDILLDYMPAS